MNQYYGYPQQQYYPYPVQDMRKVPGTATASLVLGLLSGVVPLLGLVLGIVAICLGVSADNQAKRHPMYIRKSGMSTAGQILGFVTMVFWFVVLIFAFVG